MPSLARGMRSCYHCSGRTASRSTPTVLPQAARFEQNSSRKAADVAVPPDRSTAELTTSQGALGDFSRATYHSSPTLTDAFVHVQTEAEKHSLTGHELALHWVRFHSALKPEVGDAMTVGASSPAQLETTMKSLEAGSLAEVIVEAVEGVWESAKEEVPDYSPFLERTSW